MNTELWTVITDVNQLDEIVRQSENRVVAIFKHSTRCGISKMVLKDFEKQILSEDNIIFYYLDLLNYRPISNEIADRFSVEHQSPQLIILQNNKVITHTSHNQILEVNFTDLVK